MQDVSASPKKVRVRVQQCLPWARLRGHFASAGVPIKRRLHEFRVTPDAVLPVGTEVTAAHFVPGQYVDIRGAAKPCAHHGRLSASCAGLCVSQVLPGGRHACKCHHVWEECRALMGVLAQARTTTTSFASSASLLLFDAQHACVR